jgi:hypothetical protein
MDNGEFKASFLFIAIPLRYFRGIAWGQGLKSYIRGIALTGLSLSFNYPFSIFHYPLFISSFDHSAMKRL